MVGLGKDIIRWEGVGRQIADLKLFPYGSPKA